MGLNDLDGLMCLLWEVDPTEDARRSAWREDHGPQWEQDTGIDRERYRRMAHVAQLAIGTQEVLLRAACANVDLLTRSAFTHVSDEADAMRPIQVWQQVRAALAVRPSEVAEAVQVLVTAARAVVESWYPEGETPDCVETLREALRALGGAVGE